MAYVSPRVPGPGHAPAPGDAPAPGPAPRSRPTASRSLVKALVLCLWVPLLFLFGFLLCYLLPFHAPAPHGVKVAVAGPVSAAGISAGLAQQSAGAFVVIPVQDATQARAQVRDQAAQAAFTVTGNNAVLYVAGANGSRLSQAVIAAFTPIAAAQHLTLTIVDLVPPVPGDPSGTALYYLALGWNFVPLILNLQLMQATALSRRVKLTVIVALGVFAAIAVFLVGFWLGAVPGQSLAILYGFLGFEAVALNIYGLVALIRAFAFGVAALVFTLFSVPSSGGAVPAQMVSTFFAWLHPVLPLGNLIDALRSIFYFDGTNMIRPTLVLCAWIAVGVGLITASVLHDRGRQRHPATMHPADPADRVIGQVPALFGTVTDASGAPVPGASITIIDAGGHQVLRTSTDRNGRYAAGAIPDGVLTILLSPPERMAVATRIVAGGDLPARQDFVLPDLMQDTRRGATVFYGT